MAQISPSRSWCCYILKDLGPRGKPSWQHKVYLSPSCIIDANISKTSGTGQSAVCLTPHFVTTSPRFAEGLVPANQVVTCREPFSSTAVVLRVWISNFCGTVLRSAEARSEPITIIRHAKLNVCGGGLMQKTVVSNAKAILWADTAIQIWQVIYTAVYGETSPLETSSRLLNDLNIALGPCPTSISSNYGSSQYSSLELRSISTTLIEQHHASLQHPCLHCGSGHRNLSPRCYH